ncbi:hypothetical protein FIBSPDRAFT_866823 [Athelia psychrophila]|uniref:Uncharacterized protein n=1 Tax=Athelia psychrophila TaxID=1759441 RepID=A0A166EF50_9AGAM|nr:hypothetical protein FIBSPDRAFT_866823 [Fibularhizoctonia sp. CBS 109695]
MLGGPLSKSRHLPPTTTPTRQTLVWYAPFTSGVHLLVDEAADKRAEDGPEEGVEGAYRQRARRRVGSVKALIDVSRVQLGKERKEVDRH